MSLFGTSHVWAYMSLDVSRMPERIALNRATTRKDVPGLGARSTNVPSQYADTPTDTQKHTDTDTHTHASCSCVAQGSTQLSDVVRCWRGAGRRNG